jgi:NitT/TauT family transport system permease protein
MTSSAEKPTPPKRPEFERAAARPASFGDVELPLSFWERLWNNGVFRKTIILLFLIAAWEGYGRYMAAHGNVLSFPTFTATIEALYAGIISGVIPQRLFVTLQVLLIGYALGIFLAAVVTTIAVSTRIGTDFLSIMTAMFNPLPAIAMLPVALLWFGLGTPSLVFVIVNSVLWAVSLNAHTGFLAVSETLRMAGQTFGLRGLRYVLRILIPAAFPAILAGLKIGWAFAWRTLIAAELVFGVSSGRGGLGWFIFENRNLLDTASVFAGLLTVMAVGLFVEGIIFRGIEKRTVRRWGMQRG